MSEQSYTNDYNEAEEFSDIEWEEWDGKSPFLHHCIAGSIAGVAEHTLLYPVDTIKTHMQAYCSTCPDKVRCSGSPSKVKVVSKVLHSNPSISASSSSQTPHGMWSTMRNLIKHGYSVTPATAGTSSASHLQATLKGTRQSGTLTSSALSLSSENIAGGYSRLWRGVQTMAVGCIPAHALYFSTYEQVKSTFSTTTVNSTTGVSHTYLGPVGASIAGAASTFSHDLIMTPFDTIKQRMQLGHYEGMGHACTQILQLEGLVGFYRSFGVTLLTNVPYGVVMVSTNEFLRSVLLEWKNNNSDSSRNDGNPPVLDISTTIVSGCGAGMAAAAVTTPLDRIKTLLQTQKLGEALPRAAKTCPKAAAALKEMQLIKPEYSGLSDAFGSIVKEEGVIGLWRGLAPRLMTHAPAVAISWTSYEAAKRWLAQNFDG